jgi:hypothetical protein
MDDLWRLAILLALPIVAALLQRRSTPPSRGD